MSKRITLAEERKLFKSGIKYIAGVDEVGRGPIAGPVCVCATLLNRKILEDEKKFKGLRDSKKLSQDKREYFSGLAKQCEGIFDTAVVCVSNTQIDKKGISWSIKKAVETAIQKLKRKPKYIFFDGSLRTDLDIPQKTVIKGDDKIFSIALASNCAKVFRDSKMKNYAKKYPEYGFQQHKGYGTKKHYRAIKKHGISGLHRKSFLRTLR